VSVRASLVSVKGQVLRCGTRRANCVLELSVLLAIRLLICMSKEGLCGYDAV